MSARMGDGVSTWPDGTISAVNDLAAASCVKPGMRESEAALLMLG